MPDKKLLTAAALTATLAVGGGVGALLGQPLVSGAQQCDDPTTTTTEAPADEGARRHRGGPGLEAAAEALGISVEDLRTAVREDDRTIAQVAEERGVDLQTVIDAMVAEATARIDERVAEGDLDADRAAELQEDLPERITDVVNGEGPGPGGFRHGPGGPGGFGFGD